MSFWPLVDSLVYGVSGALTAELFPARLRYSGISFTANGGPAGWRVHALSPRRW